MKHIKKFFGAIFTLTAVYLAVQGWISFFKDSGRFLANRKS